jgi:hypothetical protein
MYRLQGRTVSDKNFKNENLFKVYFTGSAFCWKIDKIRFFLTLASSKRLTMDYQRCENQLTYREFDGI